MKRLMTLFGLLLSGLLLAACAPATAPPDANAMADSSAPADVAAANIDTSDLTLIGQTGRPQFLNAYAGW